MFKKIRKKKALKAYIKELPYFLEQDYGYSALYNNMQIHKTIERHGLDQSMAIYGLSMILDREAFLSANAGTLEEYTKCRKELADLFFKGDVDFKLISPRLSRNDNCSSSSMVDSDS